MNHGNAVVGVRLLLLRDYIQANAGPKKAVKRSELEDYLAEMGFPVEKKTLYRDFDYLGGVFGLDLQYSAKHRGYQRFARLPIHSGSFSHNLDRMPSLKISI